MVRRVGHHVVANEGPVRAINSGNRVNVGPVSRLVHTFCGDLGQGPKSVQDVGKLGPHVIHLSIGKFQPGERGYVSDICGGKRFQFGFQRNERFRNALANGQAIGSLAWTTGGYAVSSICPAAGPGQIDTSISRYLESTTGHLGPLD